jgi:hypothetical protein
MAVIGNLIALAGVLIGLVALAIGAAPRTASNDLYHRLMLARNCRQLLAIAGQSCACATPALSAADSSA